jgi:hypothetical protein
MGHGKDMNATDIRNAARDRSLRMAREVQFEEGEKYLYRNPTHVEIRDYTVIKGVEEVVTIKHPHLSHRGFEGMYVLCIRANGQREMLCIGYMYEAPQDA